MGLIRDAVVIYRRSPAILALHVIGALVAWFVPEDALTRYPDLRSVVLRVGEVFPLLPRAVEKSRFPDVTAVYFALMLVATPLRLVSAFRLTYGGRAKVAELYRGFSWAKKISTVFSVLLFFCVSVFFLVIEGYYYEINFMAVSRSRLLLGVVGPLFAGGAYILCFSVSLGWICFFVQRIFSRGD